MADRSHLVPTPVTDRTGKQTTVYRRPVQEQKPKAPLPAPVQPAPPQPTSGKERLNAILGEMSRGHVMGAAKYMFLAGCTEEQARTIADAFEAHPGYVEILRAETTVHTSDAHHAQSSPLMAEAIARVYEDDVVEFPSGSGSATVRAHRYHERYMKALTNVQASAMRVGRREAGPIGSDFDDACRDVARDGIRTYALFERLPEEAEPGPSATGTGFIDYITSRVNGDAARRAARDEVLDAVMAGECTHAGVEVAIREHGATEPQQIIALAKGETPAVSDGWL